MHVKRSEPPPPPLSLHLKSISPCMVHPKLVQATIIAILLCSWYCLYLSMEPYGYIAVVCVFSFLALKRCVINFEDLLGGRSDLWGGDTPPLPPSVWNTDVARLTIVEKALCTLTCTLHLSLEP